MFNFMKMGFLLEGKRPTESVLCMLNIPIKVPDIKLK